VSIIALTGTVSFGVVAALIDPVFLRRQIRIQFPSWVVYLKQESLWFTVAALYFVVQGLVR
jgi:hypothetical protein